MAKIQLFIGGINPLPDSGRPTGIYKQPAIGRLEIGLSGFTGDQQADRRVHGGPEKAIHLYPAAHYARLTERFPEAATALVPGSLGENISSAVLTEANVRIGDIYRLGTAHLQICQPRNPCWKIDARFSTEGMAAFIADQHLTGWYWRVLTPGHCTVNDELLLDTPASTGPTLAAALQLWHSHRPALEALAQLAATPGIATQWQDKMRQRLDWLRTHQIQTSTQDAS